MSKDDLKHNRAEREKTDPRSEFYLPNDRHNRRTADPNAPVSEGPPYVFDAGAIVYQSELNPAPRRDPLVAAETVTDITAVPNFDRERWHCSRCYRSGARLEDKSRRAYIGQGEAVTYASDPDSCNGCLLSCLDGSGPNLREVRDKLFGEWAGIMAKLERHAETVKAAQLPSDKKAATSERKRLVRAEEQARQACSLAGFDPAKRRRQEARLMGQGPELGDQHDRERAFEQGRGVR